MKQLPSDLLGNVSDVFRAGDLRVDVGQQRVTRADSEIALPNLSFQLLVVLIRAAPNLVSHDQLMESVWPGLIVSPETVNKRVNLLREALGDNAQEHRYIAGVRSRGYRMVAAVSVAARPALTVDAPPAAQEGAVPSIEPSTPDTVETPPRTALAKPRHLRWIVASVLVAVIAAIAVSGRVMYKGNAERAPPPSGSPSRDAPAGELRERTVAVLPFDNFSAEAADAYLANGLPEMILNRLSRINGLSVIARNSSFVLSTKTLNSSEIGRRLNSGFLVGGSVQREADRLRVAVQLVDTAAGTLVWSAHFDRGLHDFFSIEDEIADQIAGALSVRIGELEPKTPAVARSTNLEAYLAYLRGRTLLGRFTVAESEAAVPYFERAIALDPQFASAYASLYDARMQAADQRQEDLRVARKRHRHLIDRALELDPNLGSAYFARAMWGNDPNDTGAVWGNPLNAGRELDFRSGAALDPSNGRGLAAYAEFLYWILDRQEEGKSVLKRALWVDPISPGAHFTDAMFSLDEGGARAIEQKTLQVLELDPNFVPALLHYGRYRWLFDGKLAEAIQIIEHAIALDPNNSSLRQQAVAVYLDLGDRTAARDAAAGVPRSARMTELLLMQEGDWRRAGLAAYDEAIWTNDGDYCNNWLAGEAIRDYALKTGELRPAMAFINLKYGFVDAPAKHLDVCNYHVAVYLAQLMAASGLTQQSLALQRAAASWNDANGTKYLGGARRLRAGVLLLDGKKDAALAELAESFRSGYYVHWWYTLNYDPMWLPLHSDPRFQAITADVRRYIDAQRSELEGLRRSGAVPRR